MITERDQQIIKFLESVNVAKLSQISRMFFQGSQSKLVARRRMLKIIKHSPIKRFRDEITSEYIYYLKKPKHITHSLLITEFYVLLQEAGGQMLDFRRELLIEQCKTDAFVYYKYQDIPKIAFLEVQRDKRLNITKYERLYKSNNWKKYFPVFPKIIVYTDKDIEIQKTFLNIKILKIGEDIRRVL